MNTITIRDFDTAIDAIIDKFLYPEATDIKLDENIDIKIRMVGSQWDGKIDYKISEFVIKLQKYFLNIYNSQKDERIRYNSSKMDSECVRVTINIEQGSTILKLNIPNMWNKMTANQQFIATLIGVFAIAGAFTATSIWHDNTNKEIAQIQANTEIEKEKIKQSSIFKQKIIEHLPNKEQQDTLCSMIDKYFEITENNQHMYALASKMNPEDKMFVNTVKLTAQEAKSYYRRPISTSDDFIESSYCIDGDYVVSDIKRENSSIIIRFENKKRTFSLEHLNEEELKRFYAKCALRKTENGIPPTPLQLQAVFKGGVFQQGFVEGVGAPREGAMTFQEATLASISAQEEIDAQDED